MSDEEEESSAGPSAEDERDIRVDLADLERMRVAFAEQGIKGVVIACPDCGEDHFYEWDLLRENLEHLISTGEQRTHEPAFDVDEEDYVDWEYARGYVDAIEDLGLDPGRRIRVGACPWCGAASSGDASFCQRCGRSLAPVRLLQLLRARGVPEDEVRSLLLQAGFDPLTA